MMFKLLHKLYFAIMRKRIIKRLFRAEMARKDDLIFMYIRPATDRCYFVADLFADGEMYDYIEAIWHFKTDTIEILQSQQNTTQK